MRNTKTAVPQALMMPKIPVASRPVSVPVNPMDETITWDMVSKDFVFRLLSNETHRAVVINCVYTAEVLEYHEGHSSEQSRSGVGLPDLLELGNKAEADTRCFVLKLAANGLDLPIDVFVVFRQVANVRQNTTCFLPPTLLGEETRRLGLE
jgi:hypothetical protein